jgi:biopolymer transport protein ExbB
MLAEFDWGQAILGSPIFISLIVFSVVMLSAGLERLAYYHRRRGDPDQLLDMVLESVHDGDVRAAIRSCGAESHPLGAVTRRLLESRGPAENDEETLLVALSEEKLALERNLGTLGSIAAIAPLVGLLGTVWGIMRAFGDMSATGSAAPAIVAGGVAEALTTTAAGLVIAVPAVLLYNHFTRRMNVMLTTTENGARRVRAATREYEMTTEFTDDAHTGVISEAA